MSTTPASRIPDDLEVSHSWNMNIKKSEFPEYSKPAKPSQTHRND